MRRMALLGSSSRRLARRLLPRAHAVRTASSVAPTAVDFGSWLRETQSPLSRAIVREFLGVPEESDPSSLSLQSRREVLESHDFVNKVSAVSLWAFRVHASAGKSGGEGPILEVFDELSPWGNMAKSDVWQHFYARRFFLSRAPLATFLTCYETHRKPLEADEKPFLPVPSLMLIREFVWRGRVDEALAAYSKLPLDDYERRSFTAVLYEYEQFEALCDVYDIQDELDEDREAPLLDPLFILRSLKELGLRDELVERFESLPHEQQGRADIQKLLAGA